jgi:hypothetical protein
MKKFLYLKLLIKLIVLAYFLLSNNSIEAQATAEFSLGKGYKAKYTPPNGWKEGTGYDGEKCWNSPDLSGSICVSTTWKMNRTADQILKESISGLTWIWADDKQHEDDKIRTVWKECEVKVGPRTEGRIWAVTDFKFASNALKFSVHLMSNYKEVGKVAMETMEKVQVDYTPPSAE